MGCCDNIPREKKLCIIPSTYLLKFGIEPLMHPVMGELWQEGNATLKLNGKKKRMFGKNMGNPFGSRGKMVGKIERSMCFCCSLNLVVAYITDMN